jgi:hypothetical protein
LSPQICHSAGVGGSATLFFGSGSLSFCDIGAHANFQNPTTTPSGVLKNGIKKEEKKNRRKEEKKKRRKEEKKKRRKEEKKNYLE